jgi:hypothetical protein
VCLVAYRPRVLGLHPPPIPVPSCPSVTGNSHTKRKINLFADFHRCAIWYAGCVYESFFLLQNRCCSQHRRMRADLDAFLLCIRICIHRRRGRHDEAWHMIMTRFSNPAWGSTLWCSTAQHLQPLLPTAHGPVAVYSNCCRHVHYTCRKGSRRRGSSINWLCLSTGTCRSS